MNKNEELHQQQDSLFILFAKQFVLQEIWIKMISYLIILSIAVLGSAINCGVGVPVLTRIPNGQGTYLVDFQCLCPADYYGIQCRNHRKIACYLTTKEFTPNAVSQTNFQAQKAFNITLGAECYLEQNNGKFISFINQFFKRQTNDQNYKEELQSGTDGGQIIWANNSDLLTQNGIVKYQQGYNFTMDENGIKRLSKADEEKILYGNGPYKFEYKSQFLGFPLTNSSFKVSSNIYKILSNNRALPEADLQFINYENYTNLLKEAYQKQEEAKSIYSNFSIQNLDFNKLNIDQIYKQIQYLGNNAAQYSKMDAVPLIRATIKANLKDSTQFGMLKAQFRIVQHFDDSSVRHTSINSATVRIPIRVAGIGEATVYNSNFYKPPSRIVYFFVGILVIGALYGAYRIYLKRKMSKRRQTLMKVQNQYEENSLK